MGPRSRRGRAGRPGCECRAADAALRGGRAPPHPATARVRRRGAVAPAPTRRALRRGPYGVVPLLLTPCRRGCEAAAALPPGGRLARAVEPRLLARVPRPARRARRCRRAVAVPPGPAAGVL